MLKCKVSFKLLLSIMLLVIVSLIDPIKLKATPDKLKIYVWDFAMRDRTKDDLTRNFTVEFEEALIQTRNYDVLLRRKYDMIYSQRNNEKGIMSIDKIPKSQIDKLKTIEANTIAFGEVYDDIKGGIIRVTVWLQSFNSEIIDQQSIHLRRGLRNDPVGRETIMSELAKQFSPHNILDNHDNESSIELVPKTKKMAVIKSLTFPGWGQSYTGKYKRAILYSFCEIAALGSAIFFNVKHNNEIDDYYIAENNYMSASYQESMDKYFKQMETIRDDIKNVEKMRNLSIGVAAGIWIWNVLDAALFCSNVKKNRLLGKSQIYKLEFYTPCIDGNKFIGIGIKFQ